MALGCLLDVDQLELARVGNTGPAEVTSGHVAFVGPLTNRLHRLRRPSRRFQARGEVAFAAPPCINADAAVRVSTCPRQTKLSANCRGVPRAHSPSGRTLRFRGLARESTRSGMRTDGSSMSVCLAGGSPPRPPVETRLKASIHASGVTPADAEAEISSASTSPTGWSCPRSLPTTSKQSVQGGTKWMHLYAISTRTFATDL